MKPYSSHVPKKARKPQKVSLALLKSSASALDINLLSMAHLLERIESGKAHDAASLEIGLKRARGVALESLKFMLEEYDLSDHKKRVLARVIDRLENNLSKKSIIDAYNVTCSLGL